VKYEVKREDGEAEAV